MAKLDISGRSCYVLILVLGREVGIPHISSYRLAGSRGDGRLPYLNTQGAFMGEGVPLLELDSLGRWRPRPRAVLEKLFGLGYGVEVDMGWRMDRLTAVARAFDQGDLGLAAIALVQTKLPALPDPILAKRMARADLFRKYNPGQPRAPAGETDRGRWTSGVDGAVLGAELIYQERVSDPINPTLEKKQRFIAAHLGDTRKLAAELGVPVENVLGLAALEGEWGGSRFAIQGNNFFGIHYPAPYATGFIWTKKRTTKVAAFASYSDSLRSFIKTSSDAVQGKSDPAAFAAALQDSGKFGIDPDTGKKVAGYVSSVAATIRGIRRLLAARVV